MVGLSSGTLFLAATQAAQRTSTEVGPRDPQPGVDPIVAVAFSAMAVEAFVNEGTYYFRAAQGPGIWELRDLAKNLEQSESNRDTTLGKMLLWQEATARQSLFGQQPFQDFQVLVDVRNALVHLRPDVFDLVAEADGIAHRAVGVDRPPLKRLRAKKVLAAVQDLTTTGLISAINTRAMAIWSCKIAHDTVAALIGLVPKGSSTIEPGGTLSHTHLTWQLPDFQ